MGVLDTATEVLDMLIGMITEGDSSIALPVDPPPGNVSPRALFGNFSHFYFKSFPNYHFTFPIFNLKAFQIIILHKLFTLLILCFYMLFSRASGGAKRVGLHRNS